VQEFYGDALSCERQCAENDQNDPQRRTDAVWRISRTARHRGLGI